MIKKGAFIHPNLKEYPEMEKCIWYEIGKSIMDSVKVNGYTNIQTYRLCLVLDNTEYWKEDILQTFFRLVREDEFNANDINLIDWNEVIKRYSDDLIETHIHHHNK